MRPVRKADNLTTFLCVVIKSRKISFLEPSGPLQACKGTALSLHLPLSGIKLFKNDRVLNDTQVLKLHYHVHQCSKAVKIHRTATTIWMQKRFWMKITISKFRNICRESELRPTYRVFWFLVLFKSYATFQ